MQKNATKLMFNDAKMKYVYGFRANLQTHIVACITSLYKTNIKENANKKVCRADFQTIPR